MRSSGQASPSGKQTTKKSKRTSKAADSKSKTLQKISQALGNNKVLEILQLQSQRQEALVGFICERLKEIHHLQAVEVNEMKNVREWYKNLANSQNGYQLLDATRWHESAQLYKRATLAICNGQLGYGESLLEQALAKDQTIMKTLPKQVSNKIQSIQKQAPQSPHLTPSPMSESAATIAPPDDLKFADKILNMTNKMEDTPPLPITKRQWWDEDQEEEEENEEE